MPATFSWRQSYGSTPGTVDYATGNVVNFFGGTSSNDTAVREIATGTANYNNTGSNVQAGSHSWPIHLQYRFSCATNGTFNNLKFWHYTSAFDDSSASFGVVATTQAGYTVPASRATATNQASNVAVPISSSSTSAPTNALNVGSVSTTGSGSCIASTFVCYQLTTATTAAAGDTGLAGFTGQYDES